MEVLLQLKITERLKLEKKEDVKKMFHYLIEEMKTLFLSF